MRGISINSLETGQGVAEPETATPSTPVPALAVVPMGDKVKLGGARRSLVPTVNLISNEGPPSEAEVLRRPGKPVYPALVVNRPGILKPVEVVKATINQDNRSPVTVAGGEGR